MVGRGEYVSVGERGEYESMESMESMGAGEGARF